MSDSWVKVDTTFPNHPKVRSAGPLGAALQIAAICYCSTYLTDGFISHIAVRSLVRQTFTEWQGPDGQLWTAGMHGVDAFREADCFDWGAIMVGAGLWDEVDGGFVVHDYVKHQRSREVVNAQRDAGRRGGLASAEAKRSQRQASVNDSSRQTSSVPRQSKSKSKSESKSEREDQSPAADAAEVDSKSAKERYAESYAAGIEDASGVEFPIPRTLTDLWQMAKAYGKRDGEALREDELLAWIRSTAAAYRTAMAKDAKYQSGFAPSHCLKWLASGGLEKVKPQAPQWSIEEIRKAYEAT